MGSRGGSINDRARPWGSKPLPIDYKRCCTDRLSPPHKADICSEKCRYSITSSARAIKDFDTSSPSAFAVVRLIARSNFVGCSTGKSLGFAPRRIMFSLCMQRALSDDVDDLECHHYLAGLIDYLDER